MGAVSSNLSLSLGYGFYEVSPTRELSDVQEELSTHCSFPLNTVSIRFSFSTQPANFHSIIEKYRHVLFDRYRTEYPAKLQCIQYFTEMQYFWDPYLSIIIAQIQVMGKRLPMKESLPGIFDMTNFCRKSCFKSVLYAWVWVMISEHIRTEVGQSFIT